MIQPSAAAVFREAKPISVSKPPISLVFPSPKKHTSFCAKKFMIISFAGIKHPTSRPTARHDHDKPEDSDLGYGRD
jgi:hypothetical protein